MDDTGSTPAGNTDLVELAAQIVSAFVTRNSVRTGELPGLIDSVHMALKNVGRPTAEIEVAKPVPAVSIRKSVTPDFLISLFDGKKYKSLKRHLRVGHNMTPDQYRAHWGLVPDYPMVAPNYSASRSELAKRIQFGQKRGKTARERP